MNGACVMFFKKIFIPKYFHRVSDFILPILVCIFLVTFSLGICYALFFSPDDFRQGVLVKIMYIHVPSAWLSLLIYVFISLCSLVFLIWRLQIAYLFLVSSSYIGIIFALITLVTGSLWGRPIWGVWWVWDSRLTSMFILFLFYLSNIIIINIGETILNASIPVSVFSIIGVINVPIVQFSVEIWNSLHQSSSIFRSKGIAMDSSMLLPLLIIFFSFLVLFSVLVLAKTQIFLYKIKNL